MRLPIPTRSQVVPLAAALLFACSGDKEELPSAPEVRSFAATPTEVAAGGTVELAWSVNDADSIKILDGAGAELTTSVEPSGTVTSGALTENTTFALEATNAAGTTRSTVDVTVTNTGLPTIVSLAASPNPVDFMADTTVSWEVTGADTVTIDVNGVERLADAGLMGTLAVTASDLGLLVVRLVATNANGEESQNLNIDITAPPGVEGEPNDTPAEATELDENNQATASLSSTNDVDFFVIQVPEGGWVRAETTNGAGGCEVDMDMLLVDEVGAILAVAGFGEFVLDNQGQAVGACRRLDPRVAAGARNLPGGTYYLQIESGMFQPPTGDYVLNVEVGMPGCGNGIIETNETCDDGNMMDGDSCPSTCQGAPFGTVNADDGSRNLFETSLTPLGSATIQIVVGQTSELSVLTGTGDIGACDEQIITTLLDDSGAIVQQSFGFQLTQQTFVPCGRIDPTVTPDAFPLAAGTYDLRIEAADPEASVDQVDVLVRLYGGTGCGNGYQDTNELCDDGNSTDGDRCANDCTLTTMPIGSTLDPVEVGTTFDAFLRMRINVPSPTIVSAAVGPTATSTAMDCGFDTLMAIIEPTDMVTVTGVSGGGRCAGIDPGSDGYAVGLAAGLHDFVVLNNGLGVGGPVSVTTATIAPGCGNGVPEPASNETCDDGNQDNTDFCLNDCTVNPAFSETEPNDTVANANVVPVTNPGTVTRLGSIGLMGDDVDLYAVDLPQNPDLALWTYTSLGDRNSCTGVDTLITVLDASETVILQIDDRPDQTLCSAMNSTDNAELQGLPAGRYYIGITRYMTSMGGSYFLDVELR